MSMRDLFTTTERTPEKGALPRVNVRRTSLARRLGAASVRQIKALPILSVMISFLITNVKEVNSGLLLKNVFKIVYTYMKWRLQSHH